MVSFGCTSKENVSLRYLLFQEKNNFLAGKKALRHYVWAEFR